jgi:colanic acid biosynthesis glycosyl transferase WcaI
MARILILSYFFSPDGLSTATFMSQLAQDLKLKGHDVSVIATVPHYNYDPERQAEQPLTKKWGGLYYRSVYQGVPIWHTSIGPQRDRSRGRSIKFLIYNWISLFLGLSAVGRKDVILVVSPPLTSGVIGWMLSIFKRAKYIYNIQEVFPEVYITMGAMRRNSLSARVLFRIEHFVYRTAHALTPICKSFADDAIDKQATPERVHIIPNFVDVNFLKPGLKDNPLTRDIGLVDKYVVFYAGNIGLSQSFDTLLEVAERLKNTREIVIMIVGDGVRRQEIESLIQTRELNNIILLPYRPLSHMPDVYATGDIGLVPLNAGTAKTTLPSKLYSIMASGRPVLAAVDIDSDITQMVQELACGVAVPPDDADALEAAIRRAYAEQDLFRKFGENGRRYAVENYAREVIAEKYSSLIETLNQKS